MWTRVTIFAAAAAALTACGHTSGVAPTVGEELSGNTYVPLDGLPIMQTRGHETCADNTLEHVDMLQALPDISVRFAVRSLESGAKGGFGPVAITVANQNYEAILDYVNNDAVPVTFAVQRIVRETVQLDSGSEPITSLSTEFIHHDDESQTTVNFDAIVTSVNGDRMISKEDIEETENTYTEVTFPIYVGIGLRVTANVTALQGGVNIAALGQIGAEADKLSGNLAVQSIGINGTLIGGAIPTPNKLDQTTIENAILAIGSSRTAVYANINDGSRVNLTPRVVGLYSPIGSDPRLINAIYSALAETPPMWNRPCVT